MTLPLLPLQRRWLGLWTAQQGCLMRWRRCLPQPIRLPLSAESALRRLTL
jgi:hypothetical protein